MVVARIVKHGWPIRGRTDPLGYLWETEALAVDPNLAPLILAIGRPTGASAGD